MKPRFTFLSIRLFVHNLILSFPLTFYESDPEVLYNFRHLNQTNGRKKGSENGSYINCFDRYPFIVLKLISVLYERLP